MTQKKNKGGRPRTGRDKAVTVKLSGETLSVLAGQANKTAFIDALLRGDAALIKCPHCGKVIWNERLDKGVSSVATAKSSENEPSIPEIVDEHYWEMLGEDQMTMP